MPAWVRWNRPSLPPASLAIVTWPETEGGRRAIASAAPLHSKADPYGHDPIRRGRRQVPHDLQFLQPPELPERPSELRALCYASDDTLRQINFPVSSRRELSHKGAANSVFRPQVVSPSRQNAGLPCKIPCYQGIHAETGAISTASPVRESCSNQDIPVCDHRRTGLKIRLGKN